MGQANCLLQCLSGLQWTCTQQSAAGFHRLPVSVSSVGRNQNKGLLRCPRSSVASREVSSGQLPGVLRPHNHLARECRVPGPSFATAQAKLRGLRQFATAVAVAVTAAEAPGCLMAPRVGEQGSLLLKEAQGSLLLKEVAVVAAEEQGCLMIAWAPKVGEQGSLLLKEPPRLYSPAAAYATTIGPPPSALIPPSQNSLLLPGAPHPPPPLRVRKMVVAVAVAPSAVGMETMEVVVVVAVAVAPEIGEH